MHKLTTYICTYTRVFIMFDDRIKQVDFVFQRTTQYKYSERGGGGGGGEESIFVLMPEHAVLWWVCRLLPFREQN